MKKYIVLLLVLTMLMSSAACGRADISEDTSVKADDSTAAKSTAVRTDMHSRVFF